MPTFVHKGFRVGNRIDATNNSGHVITIQKGDILTDDGTKSIALPVGEDGKVLTASSLSPSGLVWSESGPDTIANIGTGDGIYKEKIGNSFKLKTIASNTPSFTIDASSDTIELGIDTSNIDILSLNGAPDSAVVGVSDVQTLTNKTWGDDLNMGAHKIINVAAPVNGTDAANKEYVDNMAAGLDVKESVHVASTVDLSAEPSIVSAVYNNVGGANGSGQFTGTLAVSDVFTMDGVNVPNGSRVLIKNQTAQDQNGIWVLTLNGTNFSMDRAADFNSSDNVSSGAFTFVEDGALNMNSGWVLTTSNPITVGGPTGSSLNFSQFSGAGQIVAGNGLNKVNNTLNAVGSDTIISNSSGLFVNSSDVGNQVLLSIGMVGTPAYYGALPLNDSNAVTGVLPVSNGGTNNDFFIPSRVIMSNEMGDGLVSSTIDPSELVTVNGVQTLTNKTIDATANILQNISNSSIAANAQIDATKIADGSVTNASFQHLSGVASQVVGVSDAQTISNKTIDSSNVLVGTKIDGSLKDVNGNDVIKVNPVADAVNSVQVQNAATGSGPEIAAEGSDSDVDLNIRAKGAGNVSLSGIQYPNNDGSVGQVLSTNGAGVLGFATVPILMTETAETTDSVPLVLANLTVPTTVNSVVFVEVKVVCRRSDAGAEGGGFYIRGVFRNDFNVVTELGIDAMSGTEEDSVWDVSLVIDGINITVVVTGEAGKTIQWRGTRNILSV